MLELVGGENVKFDVVADLLLHAHCGLRPPIHVPCLGATHKHSDVYVTLFIGSTLYMRTKEERGNNVRLATQCRHRLGRFRHYLINRGL